LLCRISRNNACYHQFHTILHTSCRLQLRCLFGIHSARCPGNSASTSGLSSHLCSTWSANRQRSEHFFFFQQKHLNANGYIAGALPICLANCRILDLSLPWLTVRCSVTPTHVGCRSALGLEVQNKIRNHLADIVCGNSAAQAAICNRNSLVDSWHSSLGRRSRRELPVHKRGYLRLLQTC